MASVAPAPARTRRRAVAVAVAAGLAMTTAVACSADEVKEAAIERLAIGSWRCAPDVDDSPYTDFTVRIDDDGTFAISYPDAGDEGLPEGELTGSWTLEDGDLRWGFDTRDDLPKTEVRDFDSLTPESTEFTLTSSPFFEPNDGTDDPEDEQDVMVEADGTDSVTFQIPDGDPWTCDRQ